MSLPWICPLNPEQLDCESRVPDPGPRARISDVYGVAAIDSDARPVDVAGAIRCEERDDVRDFFHCAPPPRRDAPVAAGVVEELLLCLAALPSDVLGPALAPLRRDEAGDHRVDRDSRG